MRPSYLARRDGRYLMEMRVRPRAVPILGLRVLRVYLRTGDSFTARRRLAMTTVWARDFVDAGTFADLGRSVHENLLKYQAVPDPSLDALVDRQAFERVAARLLQRAATSGLSPMSIDPGFPELWDAFIATNVALEKRRDALPERRGYERGRADALAAVADGLIAPTREAIVVREADATSPPPRRTTASAFNADASAAVRFFEETGKPPATPYHDHPDDAHRGTDGRDPNTVDGLTCETATDEDDAPEWTPVRPEALPVLEYEAALVPSSEAQPVGTSATSADEHTSSIEMSPTEVSPRDEPPLGADALLGETSIATAGRRVAEAGVSPDSAASSASLPAERARTNLAQLKARLGMLNTPLAPGSQPVRLSEALDAYLEDRKEQSDDDRAKGEVAPVVTFAIDLIGDLRLDEITEEHRERIDKALVDIPKPKGFDGCMKMSLFERYAYAQAHGWENLTRAAHNTIVHRYHAGLRAFFAWMIKSNLYKGRGFSPLVRRTDILCLAVRW